MIFYHLRLAQLRYDFVPSLVRVLKLSSAYNTIE